MLEDLPDVPPIVPLLLSEVLAKGENWNYARRQLKALLPELRKQSEVYEAESFTRSSKPIDPERLDVYLDGSLNLFDGRIGCSEWDCRSIAATRLARSIGLIADTIWITDYLTERFCSFGRVTNEKLDKVMGDIVVLAELMPLIYAGIVKFRSPWIAACQNCMTSFNDKVEKITDLLSKEYSGEFSVQSLDPNIYSIYTGSLYQPPFYFRATKKNSASLTSHSELVSHIIRTAVRSALWVGREALMGGGAIFSNSKIGLAGLAYQESRVRNRSELQLLDDHRSINVPWVSDLTPSQIVQLREEASKALPMFRATLAKRLAAPPTARSNPSAKDTIDELREQAVDVRNELANVQQHAARFWKNSYMMLGLSVSAYGIGTDQTAAALAGLLPLLQLIMDHKTGTEKDMDRLERRPGYVLIKAQDILAHAH